MQGYTTPEDIVAPVAAQLMRRPNCIGHAMVTAMVTIGGKAATVRILEQLMKDAEKC